MDSTCLHLGGVRSHECETKRERSFRMPIRECSPCWPFCCELEEIQGHPLPASSACDNVVETAIPHPPPLSMELIKEVQEEVWQKIEQKYAKYRDCSCSVDRDMDADDEEDDEEDEEQKSELLRLLCDGAPLKKRIAYLMSSIPIEVFVFFVLVVLYFAVIPLEYASQSPLVPQEERYCISLTASSPEQCTLRELGIAPSLLYSPTAHPTGFSFPFSQFLMPIPACFMMSVLMCQMVANVCEVLRSGLLEILVSPSLGMKRVRENSHSGEQKDLAVSGIKDE